MTTSEESLLTDARSGDGDAFGQLFERHAKEIYNFCFRRIGDWGTAEDLVSIVFLEAWRRRDRLPDHSLPWLYGIAVNVVRNRRRWERRYAAALRRMEQRPALDSAPDASARVEDERVVRNILADVSKLPRREQDVLVLCTFLDVSYEDAALALEIPVGTVRSRLARARNRLRELQAPGGHEGDRPSTKREALEP